MKANIKERERHAKPMHMPTASGNTYEWQNERAKRSKQSEKKYRVCGRTQKIEKWERQES